MTAPEFARLLARYDAMQRLSQQMLDLAAKGDWDALATAEATRTAIEEELRQADTLKWQGPQAAKKEELIRAILALDAQTRTLVETGMQELRQTLGSIGTERKLNKAYGPG
jgi:flagellar protein FliT